MFCSILLCILLNFYGDGFLVKRGNPWGKDCRRLSKIFCVEIKELLRDLFYLEPDPVFYPDPQHCTVLTWLDNFLKALKINDLDTPMYVNSSLSLVILLLIIILVIKEHNQRLKTTTLQTIWAFLIKFTELNPSFFLNIFRE